MKKIHDNVKKVEYVTYLYDDVAEKETHIIEMANNDFELLERFEDSHKVTYRKFYQD